MPTARYILQYSMLLVLCTLLLAGCRDKKGKLEIGTRLRSDSAMMPKSPFFESGQLLEARHYVDSVFYQLRNPTVFDYLSHYNTNAYVIGISANYLAQMRYLDSAVALVRQYLPDKGLSIELTNLLLAKADVYFALKNYPVSFNVLFEAMQAVKQDPDNCAIMRVAYSIAMMLYKQQQFDKSAQYFLESLRYIPLCETNIAYRNNKEQEVLDNIGLCYTKIKKYDSAMHYYQKALDIVLKNPYRLAVDSTNSYGRYRAAAGVITGNMAKVYVGTGQTDSAIALYKRAIRYNDRVDLHDMQICMIQLSDVYLSTNDLQPLRQTLQDLRASLNTVPVTDLEMDYNRLMYAYYQKTNDAANALAHFIVYTQQKDSAAVQQNKLQQSDVVRELRDNEQQLEIRLLQKDNELSKTYLWLFGAIALMAMIILVLLYTAWHSSRKNIRKLTEMNTAVTEANRDKDRILRVVAHDLRNPIGAISTLSNLMASESFDKERIPELLNSIESLSGSSLTLINELMIAQQHAGVAEEEKKAMDLKQLLLQAVLVMQFKANEKQQVIGLELPEQPAIVKIYPVKTERLVNNLLANAIKFSPVNGGITVKLQLLGKTVRLSVTDHGIGIAPGDQVKIFDQFTSLKRPGTSGEKSFGLGLYICKQIAESMGGAIWVESAVGQGSTFFVELPG